MDDVQAADPLDPVTYPDAAREAVRKEAEIRGIGIESVPGVLRGSIRMTGIISLYVAEARVRILDVHPPVDSVGVHLRRLAEHRDDIVGLDIRQGDVQRFVLHPLRPERDDEGKRKKKEDDSLGKRILTLYSRYLFFAFLTKDQVLALQDIMDVIDKGDDNVRIAKHLGISKKMAGLLYKHLNPNSLHELDYKIQV